MDKVMLVAVLAIAFVIIIIFIDMYFDIKRLQKRLDKFRSDVNWMPSSIEDWCGTNRRKHIDDIELILNYLKLKKVTTPEDIKPEETKLVKTKGNK